MKTFLTTLLVTGVLAGTQAFAQGYETPQATPDSEARQVAAAPAAPATDGPAIPYLTADYTECE